MEASEVLEWQCYLSMEPRAELRRDINTAQICYTISQCFSSFAGSKKQLKIEDFILKFNEQEKLSESEKVDRFYSSMKNILGGKLKKVDETNKNKE